VLVVDDDAAVRELTRAILTRFGYQVTDVSHPHAALRLAREGQRFDLIVSDVVMPGMDGSEMIRELTAIAPGFEFLYISGFADASHADAALQCDAAHFLGKPFTPAALATKVRELLDAR
jgi:two-component system, cell cycle sensor histidine kinase and response regulator CckA